MRDERREPGGAFSNWGGRCGRVGIVSSALFLVASSFATAVDDPPKKASDLYDPAKVWTIHLSFSPEAWATMEPKGGMNFFDPSSFGMGMFLGPAVMRDGDADKNRALSSSEFRDLAGRWYDAWGRGEHGPLDSKQIRAGLKALLTPPGAEDRGGPPGMSLQARPGLRNGLSGMMGMDFEYVHADLEFEGRKLPDVAVRYKGNGTFMESRATLKRSFKVDLNKYIKGQKIAGVTTINLHNNVSDAGMMHESLAFRLYRDAGVPAPRTAYARVFVTVPGKHDRKYLGVYSLVENVDKDFLADRGLGKGGALFKPTSPDLFADLGDDWSAYEQTYDPKTDLDKDQKQRVIDWCRLVRKANDEEFAARLGEFIDLDEAARFLAVTVWIGDIDSVLNTGQNFYMHLDARDQRFRFIPWDKDHTFGSWITGDYSEKVRHSIREPWEGRKKFLERAFKVEAFRSRYLASMAKLNEELALPERFEAQARTIAASIRPAVEEESPQKLARFDSVVAGKPLVGGMFLFGGTPSPTMLAYVKDRAVAVKEQLEGKDEGFVMGRPKPGVQAPPGPPPFEEMIEPALMKALDADKDQKLSRDEVVGGFARWFESWDAAKAGALNEEQVRKGLNKALPFSFPGLGSRDKDPK